VYSSAMLAHTSHDEHHLHMFLITGHRSLRTAIKKTKKQTTNPYFLYTYFFVLISNKKFKEETENIDNQ
jgi:hypothetical protein